MKQATLNHSKQKIFDAVLKTAKKLEWTVNKKSFPDGLIVLEFEGNLLSYGNKIDVTIKSEPGKNFIKIISHSLAQIQIVDWGTNDRLEEKFVKTLQETLQK